MESSITINAQEVERIASLSRVGLTGEEVEESTKNLQSILGHFTVIQKVETKDISEATNMSGLHNVLRADEAVPNGLCQAEDLLARVPLIQDSHIKVKAVFNDETL